MYVRLKGLDSLSYKLASNNNFIEAKKVKPKHIGVRTYVFHKLGSYVTILWNWLIL